MNIQKKLFNAYLWSLLGKWGVRFLGIGSTLVLVRWIAPESFGLIALTTVCVGFFETLQAIGVGRYLITRTNLSEESMNSGWTLNIIIKFITSLILFYFSTNLSNFFNEPELDIIIKLVALNSFFSAFNNIGLVRINRNLEFKKIAYLEVSVKVISTVITLICAYISPDHWALIIGGASSLWLYLIGSYIICDYRPKLSFKFKKEMYSFSMFFAFRSILSYCRNRGDVFLVSKFFDSASVGKYKIGLEFATLPFSEIIAPAGKAMFPGMANYKSNKEELLDKTYKYLTLVYMFVIPSIVGIWFISPQFCTVILGEGWGDTAPMMSSLALLMLSYPISSMTNNLFDYLGVAKYGIFNDLFGLLMLVLLAVTIEFDDVVMFSNYRGYIGIAAFVFIIIFAKVTIGLSIKKVFDTLSVSLIASSFMYLILSNVYINNELSFSGLALNILVGGVSYTVCALLFMKIISPYSLYWSFWYRKVIDSSGVIKQRFFNKIVESK